MRSARPCLPYRLTVQGKSVYTTTVYVPAIANHPLTASAVQALKSGGALHLSNVLGTVQLNSSLLDGNVAGERGGGAALEGVIAALLDGTRVTNNRATTGVVSKRGATALLRSISNSTCAQGSFQRSTAP